jgi:hypothetical protein
MGNSYKVKYYQIAQVYIKLQGNCDLFGLIQDEFILCEIDKKDEEPDFIITILSPGEKIEHTPDMYSLSGSIAINQRDYLKREGGFSYLVRNLFDFSSNTELIISYEDKKSFLRYIKYLLKIFILPTGYTKQISIINMQIASYLVMWYIFHVVLLKKNCAFIHSSILQYNNEGFVFAGTGGCGKTSLSFKLLENKLAKYLSEDFGIVAADGKSYFCPKKISLYGSDVKYGQKDLVEYVNNKMKTFDRVNWNIVKLLGHNPLRKVSPAVLLHENRISMMTGINKAYYLARSSGKDICVENISNKDFVDRVLNATFRELKTIYEIVRNIKALTNNDYVYLSMYEIEEKTRRIYDTAFADAEKKIIYIPLKSSPQDIINILSLGNLN